MISHSPAAGLFNRDLQNSLKQKINHSRTIKFPKHTNVYTCGDKSENVYFIESGQIKLVTLSPEGKECLLAIYTAGDIFGELCLSGLDEYRETATTMETSFIKVIPCSEFFQHLIKESQLESFVKYLVVRIVEQQQIITEMVTIDSEHRLAETLLRLAKKLGKKKIREASLSNTRLHMKNYP